MTDYYDLVLGLIPLTVAGVTGLLTIAGVSLSVAIPIGSVCSLPLLGHAMFVNAPTAVPGRSSSDAGTETQSQSGLNTAD